MSNKQKLELTWIGKEKRPKLEPRILLEDPEQSYHAKHRLSENDIFDNRLIFYELKLGLEQEIKEIKEIDREIKEVRRTAATSPTLEEKLSWQKKQRELESKRSKLRRELFVRQDEVETQRNDIICQLEARLQQKVEERALFTIEWELA